MIRPPFKLESPSAAVLGRLAEIEREFHVRAFGEELARVNLDMTPEQRRAYLTWMRHSARRHGVKIGKSADLVPC